MSVTVKIPDFDFAGFYYPQILERLILYKRKYVPELTDESSKEPLIQFLRSCALVGHLNNTHLDMVANEGTLTTAKLQETVRNMLRLIDYYLSPAAPAVTDLLYTLSQVLLSTTVVVPDRAQASTKRQEGQAVINFEASGEVSCSRTDQFSKVFSAESGAFTDHTVKANDRTIGQTWTPWATPDVGDAVYWGHLQALWDVLSHVIATPASGITGVWEYYDGKWAKTSPTAVANMGGYLRIDLTSYLGTDDRTGTRIRSQLNETTATEFSDSYYSGGVNYVDLTGYLGQTSPSLDPADYTVGSDWEELPAVADGTSQLTASGPVGYQLPQDVAQNWIKGLVNGVSAYWVRYRIVAVIAPVGPVMEYSRLDEGKQYVLRLATQGLTKEQDPLGSSDGSADQRFETSEDGYLDSTMEVWVDDVEWSEVDDFLASQSGDLHFRVELDVDNRATVVFGNGSNGRIPPAGLNNIRCRYRYGADDDGNVGPNTITVDKTGLSYVSSVTNPRGAAGWALAEGSTEESLEQAKVAGPASLRTKDVAIGPQDVETLAKAFKGEDGSKPFARAKAIEEGYGPKTIELILVASGGGQAPAETIAEIATYFNGDRTVYPPKTKHLVANQEVVPVNFSPRVIDISATVYGSVDEETIRNQLAAVIQPLAVKEDGVTWEWDFEGEVPTSRIQAEIFFSDPDITKVVLTVPASDVVLLPRELPVLGTVSLTIVG